MVEVLPKRVRAVLPRLPPTGFVTRTRVLPSQNIGDLRRIFREIPTLDPDADQIKSQQPTKSFG